MAMQRCVIKQPVGTRHSLSLFSVQEGSHRLKRESETMLTLQSCQSYYRYMYSACKTERWLTQRRVLCKITLFLILRSQTIWDNF